MSKYSSVRMKEFLSQRQKGFKIQRKVTRFLNVLGALVVLSPLVYVVTISTI